MKKIIIPLLFIAVIILACSGNRKQGLTDEPQTEEAKTTTIYESEEVMDSIIPAPGVKYKGSRAVDVSNPPLKLNLANQSKEDKSLDVADYYSKVKYVKLKHPLPSEQGGFLGDANMHMYYEQGSSSGRGINSNVYLAKDKIIAGDRYFGYHCYDKDGTFEYSIITMNRQPDYNSKTRTITINWDKSLRMFGSFTVLGDNCLFTTSENGRSRMFFHNLTKRKNYLERPSFGGELCLLNPTTFVSYSYRVQSEQQNVILGSLDYKGDILCTFLNYNPLVKDQKKAATNPDQRFLYYYDDQLTVRQGYNDTIYRMVSEKELKPVYIMDFGKQKLDGETGLYGDKSDKLIPYVWTETSDFIFIMYTKNYDCPNTRNNGSVIFNYAYYDKASKKLYNIPSHKLPEEFVIENSLEGGIPLIGNNMMANGKRLHIGYTKYQLESIIKQKDFASLPQPQQDNLKKQYEDLGDQEMLVMILE
ncbi:MAG: DUF4933 domain-containing protein [Dysgonomonas sp.]